MWTIPWKYIENYHKTYDYNWVENVKYVYHSFLVLKVEMELINV